MKIVRFLDSKQQVKYGSLQADNTALEISGDIFGKFLVGKQSMKVGKLLAPIVPSCFLCIGLNYRRHAEECKATLPEFPVLFMKTAAAVQNPGDPIELPRHLRSDEVDYECELAVVISRKCKNVSRDKALDYVLGYACANDVSARDWQGKWGGSQWCRGKTFDTFAPAGPVPGHPRRHPESQRAEDQAGHQRRGIAGLEHRRHDFRRAELIEFLSGSTTLLPGTVILTGTPQGIGAARKPAAVHEARRRRYRDHRKDRSLTNPVIEEPK